MSKKLTTNKPSTEPVVDKQVLDAREKLYRKGNLEWKLSVTQKKLNKFIKDNSNDVVVISCTRRGGKCIGEGTEVMTPTGSVQIQDLKVGDTVYGYNKDGSVSPTKVLAVEFQGEKEVVDLLHNTRVLASATLEHRWQTYNTLTCRMAELTTDKLSDCRNKIVRKFVKIPGGKVNEPQAYALGALIGDGCSKQNSKRSRQIFLSSENGDIPHKVAKILNCKLTKNGNSFNNYTWALSDIDAVSGKGIRNKRILSLLYYEWCHDRYAHEKTCDINVIKSWNRKSQLAFLAGLIDTDGSVFMTSDNNLNVDFGCQALPVVEAFQSICLSLFQYKPTIYKDNRTKYKNGPVYRARIKNNIFAPLMLKELSKYIVTPRKQWKPEYELLNANNGRPHYVGVKLGPKRIARTWDIQVDNETNLYLLANGLVTHNSHLLMTLAVEQCIKVPNSIVIFLQPKQNQIRKVLREISPKIIGDCPADIRPTFSKQENVFFFPNGSEIRLAGTDNGNIENVRGASAHLCLVDEAGFCDDLDNIIDSVLFPMTTKTGGKIILSSTVPKDPNHKFIEYMETAQKNGALVVKTIFDFRDDDLTSVNPQITDAMIARILKKYEPQGGIKADKFRNEYLCVVVHNSKDSVIPEFSPEIETNIVKVWPASAKHIGFFHRYVGMDVGFRDLTVVLFAYYDFLHAKLIIQDEIVINGPAMTTDVLAAKIKAKEKELWRDPLTNVVIKPKLRVSDNDLKLINDLQIQHNLTFMATKKDNKELYINSLRMAIGNEQVIIDPKCTTLIHHLKTAVWNKERTDFKRTPDGAHADAVASIMYLHRNVDKNSNPFPKGFQVSQQFPGVSAGDLFVPVEEQKPIADRFKGFQKLFIPKKKTK